MDKIKGMLLYVQIQRPTKAYQKPGTDPKPDEWKASIAVSDEDVVDAFEEYAKEIDAKISIKKVKTSEFEATYKVAPPEDAGKNVWVLTFRKSTELGKTGKLVPDLYKPKVFEKVGNNIVDVTNTKLPANGSMGAISLDVFTRTNGTSSIYLKNVLVTKMIEYIRPDNEKEFVPGSEFDEVDDGQGNSVAVPEKAKAPAAKKKAVPPLDDDEDVPF